MGAGESLEGSEFSSELFPGCFRITVGFIVKHFAMCRETRSAKKNVVKSVCRFIC